MYCLLCHEKIPRLRAWRTKSEFCCDEHAALYKKQTLERLLVDPAANHNGQAELPEPPEPEEFEPEELEPEFVEDTPRVAAREHDNGRPQWEAMDFPGEFESEADLPVPAADEEHEDMDELRRLASEVRGGYGGGYAEDVYFAEEGRGVKEVSRQSAEEALEALRQLASRAKPAQVEEEENFVQPEPAPTSEIAPAQQPEFDRDAVFAEIRDLAGDERFAHEPDMIEEVVSLEEADELDAPDPAVLEAPQSVSEQGSGESILDDLMEDPLKSWQSSRDVRAGRTGSASEPDAAQAPSPQTPAAAETPAPPEASFGDESLVDAEIDARDAGGEAAEALQELVSALDDGASEDLPAVDLDAPEPDWAFDGDDANQLAALKESLASTGTAEVRLVPETAPEMDAAPDEPAWDELDVELDEHDIEPPEPELEVAAEDEPDQELDTAPAAALTSYQAMAETNGAPQVERASHVRQAPSTRFRAIFEFAEIQLQMAGRPITDSDDPLGDAVGIRSLRLRQLEIVPPASRETLLPEGRVAGPSSSGSIAMHELSVDLEPAASLETAGLGDLTPRLEPAASPFAPGGLFFDIAGGAVGYPLDDDEAESSVTAGGRNDRS